MKKILIYIFLIVLCNQLSAQLFFKRDDFVGSLERRWWRWHNDPEGTPSIAQTAVHDGYASFTLNDAIENLSFPFYCDAALWDGVPIVGGPYYNAHVKARIRVTTPMQDGSIGWGLWHTEGNFSVSQLLWFMQSQDISGGTGENWWIADKVNGNSNRQTEDLVGQVNTQAWHTYEIIRAGSYIDMIVDNESVLYSTTSLPDQDMAFHIWVDNIVYEFSGSGVSTSQRNWSGTSQILMDYVQIVPEGITIDKSESASGIKLLREVPNDVYSETTTLWHDYAINSPSGGNFVFLITGRAEYYSGESTADIDDDLRFIIDGVDYQWNSVNSFNPQSEGTISKTMMFEQVVAPGGSNIQVYAETSPLLYDVTVIGNATGSVLYDNEFNQTKSGPSAELWHEIPFSTGGGGVAIYVSGTADEDLFPSSSGNNSTFFDDDDDDDLRIVVDGFNYGYQSDEAFYGNELFGDPKSILITEDLDAGDHTLQVYGIGTPTLYRIVIYGNSSEASLPVTLTSFNGTLLPDANQLEWITESEINNFGFNIYRAESKENVESQELEFIQINDAIISGAGNSSVRHTYSFKDKKVKNDKYYWYQLEDIDYEGVRTQHNIVSLYRENILPGKFEVYNNYPNPFNGSTNISFYLSNDTPVQISFFNNKGQIVQSLAPKIYSKGVNKIKWKNNDLTSGIYYCNISAFQTSQTIKMLYVK